MKRNQKKKTSKVLIAIKLCGLAAVKGTLLSELMNKFSISIRRTIGWRNPFLCTGDSV